MLITFPQSGQVRTWVNEKRIVIVALIYYVFVNAADIWTSMLRMPIPTYETNKFMRNAVYHFILIRALDVKVIFSIALLLFSAALYGMFKGISEKVAQTCFAAPFVFIATSVLFGAVLTNILLYFGWYQP